MASNTHTEAEANQSDTEYLLQEMTPYISILTLKGFGNIHPSPGEVSENYTTRNSEVAEKTGNIYENIDKRLISPDYTLNTIAMLNDKHRSNDIRDTDFRHSSGEKQALTRSENNIQMAWNAEINTNGKRTGSKQKVSNITKEYHAGLNTETINNSNKFLNVSKGSATDILEGRHKTVQSHPSNSTEADVTAGKITPPKDSLQCLDSPAMQPVPNFPSEDMLLTLSALNETIGPFTELKTQITSTTSATSKHSVGKDCDRTQIHATSLAKSISKKQESKSTVPKEIYHSTKTKKSNHQPTAAIYSGLLENDISHAQVNIDKSPKCVNRHKHVNNFSLIDSPVIPRSYPTESVQTLPPSPPPVKAYSLLEKHCPRAVRRKLFSPSKPRCVKPRLKKYTPTLHLETNHNQKKSNAESRKKKYRFKAVGKPTKICNKINRKTVVIPGNTDASIGTPLGGTVPDIRNKSVTRTESTQAAVLQTASEESELSAESTYSDQDIVKTSMILSSLLTPSQNPSAGTILTPTNNSVCGSCVPMKIPTLPMYSAAISGPLMTSVTSDEKNRSVANNIDKCLSPDTATSNSVILPEVARYSYKNTDTLKVTTKDRTYHRVPNNTFGNSLTETADLQKTSLKPRNCLWPTSYAQNLEVSSTETSHSWTAGEFHQPKGNDSEMNALNSIQADGAKYVERSPRRVCCRLSGRKRVQTYGITANKGSKQNTRTGYDMQKSLYFDCYTADPISHWHSKSGRGSRPCRSNIRNFTEECKGMKSKDPKLKIKMGDQKNDAKINKKRAYTRRNIGQDSSNNNKSLMTLCSNYTDQFSSKQSPKSLSTCEAQCILHHIIRDKCENYFSSKNHHESRWSGQQISTSEESRKTLISASPYEQITNHTTCNYESTSNGQYFPSEKTSYLIIADGSNQCSSADNKSTENSVAVSSCSFINNKQQMEREYEYSPPMVTQYQQNFINTSDSIHNTYTPYHLQESTSQMQYNDQYFPSFKNNNRETCTGMYEYADMLSDTFRFNRDQDQQNEYSQTSIIHDGYQNLMDETEANNYAHQLEENRQNNEYLQQSVDYNHISALCSTHNYCRMNQPAPTQSFVGYQPCSEIANVDDSQYYQLSSNITNLDEYYLPSSRALSTEDYQQTMFKRNENILNKQIINNQEHTNVLPNEEMFREKEEWQNPDFYSNHNNSVVQETYFNDKESIAYNSAGQTTSGYPYDSTQPPVQSNSFSRCDGKFLRPHSQFPDNFKLTGISEMSVNYRNMKLDVCDEKYAGTEKGNRKERKHRGRKKPDYEHKCPICGKNEQYKVLLNRHVELQHKHNNEN